jgi:hypothetical protein
MGRNRVQINVEPTVEVAPEPEHLSENEEEVEEEAEQEEEQVLLMLIWKQSVLCSMSQPQTFDTKLIRRPSGEYLLVQMRNKRYRRVKVKRNTCGDPMVDIDAEVDDRDFDASEVSTWVGQTKGNTGAFDLCVCLAVFISN